VHIASTPALRASIDQLAEQITKPLSRTLAAQLEPALRVTRLQVPPETFQSITRNQSAIRKSLNPVMLQIAGQQKEWLEQILAPLTKSIELPRITVDPLANPELTAALQRISENLRVPLSFQDGQSFGRVSELIDAGEIDETVLEAAELGLGTDGDLQASIEKAAEVLATEHRWMSRARARQVVVVLVWLMWVGVLVGIEFLNVPIAGPVVGALDPKERTRKTFDKIFPPEEDSIDD